MTTELFGTKAIVCQRFVRLDIGDERKWKTAPIVPVAVLIIGKRTLSNGVREYDEDGITYYPSEHFPALLVVADMRTKPFLVPPSAVLPFSA